MWGEVHAPWDKQIDRTAVEKGILGHFAVNATVTKEPGLLGGICSDCISLYLKALV